MFDDNIDTIKNLKGGKFTNQYTDAFTVYSSHYYQNIQTFRIQLTFLQSSSLNGFLCKDMYIYIYIYMYIYIYSLMDTSIYIYIDGTMHETCKELKWTWLSLAPIN